VGDSVEATLCRLWSSVLGCATVGPNDNFFELGGDSLRAMELCAFIERAGHRRLPWTAILEAPTPGRLAGLLLEAEHDFSRIRLRSFSDLPEKISLIYAPFAMTPRTTLAAAEAPGKRATSTKQQRTADRSLASPDPRFQLAASLGPEVGLYSFDY